MSCDYCTDPDGAACFPIYGVGPHIHEGRDGNPLLGATVLLPRDEWPENYRESEDDPGHGIWWCPRCGDGKPDESTQVPDVGLACWRWQMDEEAARKLDELVVEMYALCARWDANRSRRRVPTHIAAALMNVAAEIAALRTSKDQKCSTT